MKNIFSIDMESWVHFYEDSLKLKKISSAERKKLDRGYITKATADILALLAKHRQKATFFIVAEIHSWYPGLIQSIKKQGHEIGYHTHTHLVVKTEKILEQELLQSQKFLRDFKPRGFRAPLIYLPESAFPVLEKNGFTYSSSSYDNYHITHHSTIAEIPVSTISWRDNISSPLLPKPLTFSLLSSKIPVGGGLAIALFGSRTSKFIRKLNAHQKPGILFIHPWQLYQTREITSLSYKMRLLTRNPLCFPYTHNVLKTIEKLFKAHEFTSFQDFYGQQGILGQ
jgi:peptidoglycan/xylan/chitin deacetylase (PgdA/CDA1 family)